jgi:hypothetical protein
LSSHSTSYGRSILGVSCISGIRWICLGFLPLQQLLHVFIVLLTENASSLFPLKKKIVSCCGVVESVALNFRFSFDWLNVVVFLEHSNDLTIYGDGLFGNVDGWSVRWLMFHRGVPRVTADVFDRVPLGGVWVQDAGNQILGVF